MADGTRVMVYDDTCRTSKVGLDLTRSWIAGGALYRALGRIDAHGPVRSWAEAFKFILEQRPREPIAEVQFWGHGKWGEARIEREPFGIDALSPTHALHPSLCELRERLVGEQALVWFRSCETVGAHAGHDFAQALADFLGCQVAGHTFIIGPWQSGLHRLRPGERPTWSVHEGLAPGNDPAKPKKALWSGPLQPNTITCLQGEVPAGF